MTQLSRGALGVLLALFVWFGAALAQDNPGPDYVAWDSRATTAEQALENGQASDSALEALRSEIAAWRSEFLAAQGSNAQRITALQDQIAALGPAPEDGQAEPEDIAARRAELEDQLARLQAPVRRAEEAYTRADGLVRGIDALIRERQTDALTQLGPIPLNPALWPAALEDLSNSLHSFWAEIERNAASPNLRAQMIDRAPVILGYLALALVLLARGNFWARAGVARLRSTTRRGTGVWRFVLSLGQIALPLIGLWALTQAVLATGLIGVRWSLVVEQLPSWAGTLLGIRWLAEQGFGGEDGGAILPLPAADRRRARRYANLLSLLFVLNDVLKALTAFDNYEPATVAVLNFPLLVLSGLFLARLGTVRSDVPVFRNAAAQGDDLPFRMRFARLLGRGSLALGIAGPLIAAIGFYRVGEALIYPAIASLALVGMVLVLQRFVSDFYELLTGRDPDEEQSLIPVLGGFALVLAALPLLALIWGARVADLTELWARFREGFQLGETRISPTDFLVVLIVFVIGYMLTRLLQSGLRSTVLPKTRIDVGGQNAIVSGVGYVGIFLSALVAISTGGLDLSSLAIVAGALSVGIGFGLQNIVSNFVSGIILLIERPISQGDWIEVGGQHGIVKEISVRSTRIETFDRFDLIVPNSDLVSGQVRNYTHGNLLGRIIVTVGVAYGTDTRKVESILLDIARRHDMVLMTPEPAVLFTGFGADSLDFEIRAVLRDVNKTVAVRSEMNHQIAERFAEEGIEIPFAQRDIWIRNPEALQGGGAVAAGAVAGAGGRQGAGGAAPGGETGDPEET